MAEQVLASTMIAPKTFEVREYPHAGHPPRRRSAASGSYWRLRQ